MASLFNRRFRANIGGVLIENHDVSFSIVKTIGKDPNTCQLSIYNLPRDTRVSFQEKQKITTRIEAGYQDEFSEIYFGDISEIQSTLSAGDWLTTLRAQDGGRQFATARVSKSFAPGTSFDKIAESLVDSFGLKKGNALEKIKEKVREGKFKEAIGGFFAEGKVSEVFGSILRDAGLGYSIQGGELQVIDLKGALADSAVELNAETGLIGSPEIGKEGIIKAKSLLQPDLVPGRRVLLKTSTIKAAFFRVDRVEFTGETSGQAWYSNLELRKL